MIEGKSLEIKSRVALVCRDCLAEVALVGRYLRGLA